MAACVISIGLGTVVEGWAELGTVVARDEGNESFIPRDSSDESCSAGAPPPPNGCNGYGRCTVGQTGGQIDDWAKDRREVTW